VIGLFLSLLVLRPAVASAYVAIFNAMRGDGMVKMKDFFSAFRCSKYCKLLVLSLWLVLGTATLWVLLVLPGLWFAVASSLCLPLLVEHDRLGVTQTISLSIKAINGHFCSVLCFYFLCALLNAAGAFCFGVGLLLTLPVSLAASCALYHDIIGVKGLGQEDRRANELAPVVYLHRG